MIEEQPVKITSFEMGAEIPDWLFSVDPMTPGAQRGKVRFASDVDVIDMPGYMLVIGRAVRPSTNIIDVTDSHGCRISAATKFVRIVGLHDVFFPPEFSQEQIRGILGPLPPPLVQPPASPAVDELAATIRSLVHEIREDRLERSSAGMPKRWWRF